MRVCLDDDDGFCEFCDIRKGDCFLSNGVLFMRTDEAKIGSIFINAVNLSTGVLHFFMDFEVQPVKCKVVRDG